MSKGTIAKRFVSLGTMLILLFSITVTAYAVTSEESTTYNYVAFGDSLAAGQTPYGVPSGYGYTDMIADYLDKAGVLGNYVNYGVSGYTTADVMKQLSNPDIQASISNANIITLDIGANDILVTIEAVIRGNKNQSDLAASTQSTCDNIKTLIESIRTLNPTAKMYVMGYYNALPRLTDEQSAMFLSYLSLFNTNLEKISNNCSVTYVDTYNTMNIHLLNYLPGDVHPTMQGYRAIANEFCKKIKVDFNLTESSNTSNVLITPLQLLLKFISVMNQK